MTIRDMMVYSLVLVVALTVEIVSLLNAGARLLLTQCRRLDHAVDKIIDKL